MKKRVLFILLISCLLLVSCGLDEVVKGNYQAESKFTITVSPDLFNVADIYVEYNESEKAITTQKSNSDTNQKKSNIKKLTSSSQTFSYSGSDSDTVGFIVSAQVKDSFIKKDLSAKDKYNLSVSYKIDIKTKSASDTCEFNKEITGVEAGSIQSNLESILPMYCIYELDEDGTFIVRKEAYQDGEISSYETPETIQTWTLLKEVAVFSNGNNPSTALGQHLLDETLQNQGAKSKEKAISKPGAVVILGNYVDSLQDADYKEIVSIAAGNGEIILLEINKTQFKTFVDKFIKSYDSTKPGYISEDFLMFINTLRTVGADYVYFEDEKTTYGIIGIRNSNLFFISSNESYSEVDNNSNIDPTELANNLVKWITKEDDYANSENIKSKALKANTSEAQQLSNAQIIDDCFIATAPNDWRQRRVPVHVRFYIWTAHNLDTGHDFYIVQEEVNAENQKWYCEIQNEKKWIEGSDHVYGNHDGSYGPYQRTLNMRNEIRTIDNKAIDKNVVLTKYAPINQSGSASVSTGVVFELKGNVGVGEKGPSGGLNGRVQFSNSTTVSIPDISIIAEQDGSEISWTYDTPDINIYERPFHWAGHTLTKNLCVSSMSVMNSWIWDVDNKHTGEVYLMEAYYELISEAIDYDDNFFSFEWKVYNHCNYVTKRFALNPPSRFKANYLLQADVPEDWDYNKRAAFQNFMVKKFKNWFDNMDLYSPKNDLDDVAKNHFDEAVRTFEKNTDVIKSAGFEGTFRFYIKNTEAGTEITNKTITIQ